MNEPTLFLTITAGLILITGVLYVPLQRSVLTEPLLAMLVGIAAGPLGFGLLNVDAWGQPREIVHHVTKYLLMIALMAAALRLPHRYPRQAARSQLLLVFGGMTAMTVASAVIVHLSLELPALICLAIGAIIAPTDPVLATTIVTGRTAHENVKARVRHLLTGESGANDCLAFPFVLLPLSLLNVSGGHIGEGHIAEALRTWLVDVVLYQNLLAIVAGVGLGWAARLSLKYGFEHHSMSSKTFLSYTLALGLLTLNLLELFQLNALLGVFVTGMTFNYGIGDREEATSERVQEMVERLFVVPGFVLFGAILPWSEFAPFGWRAIAVACLVLALRRLPALFVLYRFVPELRSRREALFVGWFGPMGVAALHYASHAYQLEPLPELWTLPCLAVFTSVIAHGITCSPLVAWYGRTEANPNP